VVLLTGAALRVSNFAAKSQPMNNLGNVAIIGAGMAGLSAARVLAAAGIAVTVFDKGRQPGGRLATRRVEDWVFNHGCQYFTIRDSGFADAVKGVCAPWEGLPKEGCYAGVPDMAAVAKHLAAGLNVRQHAHVRALARHGDRWGLRFDDGEQSFDTVILAIPAPQAASLLAGRQPAWDARLQNVRLAPCWAVMLGFAPSPPPTALETMMNVPAWPDGIWFALQGEADFPVAWAVRENMRPLAPPAPPAFLFHFSAAWSAAHLEDAPDDVIGAALEGGWEFGNHKPAYAAAHRWRYALAEVPLGEEFLWDEDTRLGLCGDWCLAGRLEAAYLSGRALGIRLAA
jgi:predicted NAD/FAD-dependent oxidoreductase